MSWLYKTGFGLLAVLIAVCVFAAIEVGFRLGRRVPVSHEQTSTVASAILALVGLLLAFSFSLAGERLAQRRAAEIDEANAIGTFWLRTSLVPEPTRSQLRSRLQRYVDVHLLHRKSGVNDTKRMQLEAELDRLQQELWSLVVEDVRQAPESNRQRLVVPALNAMIDGAATTLASSENRLPDAIFVYLTMLLVVAGLVVGYRPRHEGRSIVQWLLFTVVVSGVLAILLDMDRPRRGFIENDPIPYERLRRSMESH